MPLFVLICSDFFRCVFRTNQNKSGKPPFADPLLQFPDTSREEKSIHHHRGNRSFFLFPGLRLSMVYTLLSGPMVYTLFPCFPKEIEALAPSKKHFLLKSLLRTLLRSVRLHAFYFRTNQNKSGKPPFADPLLQFPDTSREEKSIHHHRGDPSFFLFPGLRLYGVYPSFRTYGVYPFPLFSQENGIHHSFFCSVTLGSGDRRRKEGSPERRKLTN